MCCRLQERVHDRLVRGSNRVKDVTRDHHELRIECYYPIYGMPERPGDVCLTLVDAGGRLPLELPEA